MGKSGHWLFERPNLAVIEAELNRHGFTLTQTFHMFLPGGAVPKAVMPKGFTVRWFDAESVSALYPNRALSERSRCVAESRPAGCDCGCGMRWG